MKALSILVVCALLSATGASKAATITETYDFTAMFPSGAPINPWVGSLTITFDPTFVGSGSSTALDAFSSNLPASYGTFTYIQGGPGNGTENFAMGNTCAMDPLCPISGPNQAVLNFQVNALGVPDNGASEAAIGVNPSGAFLAVSPDVTVTLAPATPLPAALPLFATGLGGLGLLGWRRKRKTQAVA